MSCGAAADVRVNAAQRLMWGKPMAFRRATLQFPFVLIHRCDARVAFDGLRRARA